MYPYMQEAGSRFRAKHLAYNNLHLQKKETLLTTVKQEVIVELFQGVTHIVRHGTLFIL